MTGSELRSALKILEMKQLELAGVLGLCPDTISRYVKGRHAIPIPVEIAVNHLLGKQVEITQ